MSNYYKNIDEIPIYNWLKVNEGKLNYCRKDLLKGNNKDDLKYYEIIKDTNYEMFGVEKEHLRLLELYFLVSEARLDWVITGDNFIKNKINMYEVEIEDILNRDDKGVEITELVISLSKWIGYRIDTKIVTVLEFRNMISLYKKEYEARKNK